MAQTDEVRAVWRLRIGVGLFVLSWLPIAQLWIWIAGLSGSSATELRGTIWAVQWTIGFIGLALAGVAAKSAVHAAGWKGLPRALWQMLRYGRVPEPST